MDVTPEPFEPSEHRNLFAGPGEPALGRAADEITPRNAGPAHPAIAGNGASHGSPPDAFDPFGWEPAWRDLDEGSARPHGTGSGEDSESLFGDDGRPDGMTTGFEQVSGRRWLEDEVPATAWPATLPARTHVRRRLRAPRRAIQVLGALALLCALLGAIVSLGAGTDGQPASGSHVAARQPTVRPRRGASVHQDYAPQRRSRSTPPVRGPVPGRLRSRGGSAAMGRVHYVAAPGPTAHRVARRRPAQTPSAIPARSSLARASVLPRRELITGAPSVGAEFTFER